jgi:hypothetical protein
MRVHYRHGTADRRLLKGASIGLGTVLAVALVIWPPVEIWRHVLAWVLAATAVLGGLLSLLMRPRRHLLITDGAVILHPDGPRRVVPLMQIHHVEVIGSAATRPNMVSRSNSKWAARTRCLSSPTPILIPRFNAPSTAPSFPPGSVVPPRRA